MDIKEIQERMHADGVDTLRIEFPDLYGQCRSKAFPASRLEAVVEDGVNFAKATYAVDLSADIPPGTGIADEIEWTDMTVYPDLDTYSSIPYLPHTGRLLGTAYFGGKPATVCPRNLLKRVVGLYKELNLTPICATELEFFLYRLENGEPGAKYSGRPARVYTTGHQTDDQAFLRGMQNILMAMGLDVLYMNHEFFPSQYEINWSHSNALKDADNAFTFKTACQAYAFTQGLHATFMDRPQTDGGGSGYHVHFSLSDDSGKNLFDDPNGKNGLSELALNFIGGQMAHAKGMTPFMLSSINAYRRVMLDGFAPYFLTWGLDNRTVYIRVPGERGKAARCENRGPGAGANPYLVLAVSLLAGLDGIKNKLDPGAPFIGDAYRQEPGSCETVPFYLQDALAALQRDTVLCEAIGKNLVACYSALKNYEVEMFRTTVTDWEWEYYTKVL